MARLLPQLYNVVTVALRLLHSPMPSKLIVSLGAMSSLERLSIENPHLDPVLDTVPDLTCLNGLQCLILTVSVSEHPPNNINIQKQREFVKMLIAATCSSLTHLEVAGDLILFETIASLQYPVLETFCISGHYPTDTFKGIARLIMGMPNIQHLHSRFSAAPRPGAPPFTFFLPGDEPLPELRSLTVSNVQPNDLILCYLPPSLSYLEIASFKDEVDDENFSPWNEDWSPYYPLSNDTVQTILYHLHPDARSNLAHLSLELDCMPTPELILAISQVCPALTTLQLTRSFFEEALDQLKTLVATQTEADKDEIKPYISSLLHLPFLTELRISLGFPKANNKEEPHMKTARWLGNGLPKLRRVGFTTHMRKRLIRNKSLPRTGWSFFCIFRDPCSETCDVEHGASFDHGYIVFVVANPFHFL